MNLNPLENVQGTAGNMNLGVVDIFRQPGFQWGGEWQGKSRDPMHFQFCTGY
jgi:D-alanyl-D-alanine carboxypeptidase